MIIFIDSVSKFHQRSFQGFCLAYHFLLNLASLHARMNSHYIAWSYKKKKSKKIKSYRESIQEEPAVNRCLLILDLKPFRLWVMTQTQTQAENPRVQLCEEKNVDVDILEMLTEKSYYSSDNKQTSFKKKEVESFGPVLKKIYQSNIYRNESSWPHKNDEPRFQEKLQVNDQQSCIFVFVASLTIPSSNQRHQSRHDNGIPYMGVWSIYRDTEQPQEKETSQNELGLQFSWREFQQQR